MNFKISLKLLALGTTTAKLSSHTSAFMPSSSSKIRASAIRTASTTRMKASRKPAPISATGGNIKISSLTVPQLKAVLSEQGLPVSGDKNELVSRLSDLALQKKQEQVSKLSSMAMEQKQRKKSSKVDSTPSPSIKKQVAEAVESHKKKAKARANSTNKNTNDGNVLTTKQKKRKKPSKVNLVTPPSINNQVADREDSHEELEIEVENTNVSNNNGFSKIDVPDYLVARLNEMGIFEPTPIQTKAIPLAIRGKDVMGLAQTGTGKTLAFGLPLVAQMMEAKNGNNKRSAPKGVQGLVLAPTRELATQIAVQLGILTQGSPIRTFVVVGGQNINAQINKLKDGTEILVATPGRLIDLMDRRAVSLKGTTFLVLDEADLMLDMGFLPSLKKISSMLPKKRQTMLFSATMSKNMNVVASSYLKDPVRVEVAKAGVTADKVSQEIHFIAKANKAEKLLELLQNPDHKEDRSIVFGRTKHGMEKLSKKLLKAGIKAGSIHGNKSQNQRDKAIAAFKSGEIKVLVATDVAARGLDIPDVKHVYNFELPNVAEAYVHRIGRTARAGKEGAAIAFCSVEEMEDLIAIQRVTGVKIPVASGEPWSIRDSKDIKAKLNEKKRLDQQKQRENRKKNQQKKQGNSNNKQGRYR